MRTFALIASTVLFACCTPRFFVTECPDPALRKWQTETAQWIEETGRYDSEVSKTLQEYDLRLRRLETRQPSLMMP